MCKNTKNTIIVGLGNILLKDEGVGIWIARELKKKVTFQKILKLLKEERLFWMFSSQLKKI